MTKLKLGKTTENGGIVRGTMAIYAAHRRQMGDCYKANAQALEAHNLGNHIMPPAIGDAVLVHGRPTLQVEPFVEYGHAWLEMDGKYCYDGETKQLHPKKMFYELGKIKEEDCLVYTYEQMEEFKLSHNHYGPWEGPEAQQPFTENELNGK